MRNIQLCVFIGIFSLLISKCSKDDVPSQPKPVKPPLEMVLLAGNNQIGGYKIELADTLIIKITPNDTSDLSRYFYGFDINETVGRITWLDSKVINGEIYVRAVWLMGTLPVKQEMKFYVLGNCDNPVNNSTCKRLDSVTITATIREPWERVFTGTGSFEDIHFLDLENALAIGERTGIVRTSDGGNNWISSPAFRDDLYQLNFLNNLLGFVTVSNNYLFFTYDGGKTFGYENSAPPIIGHLSSADFYIHNRDTILSVGGEGTIVKTTDGGLTWQRYMGSTFINGLKAITCVTRDICYVCGDVAKIVKTTNGGSDWQEQVLLLNHHLKTIYFLDQHFGFAAGQYGILVRTTNGGQVWNTLKTSLKGDIIKIHFFNREHGVVISNAGEISETRDGGLSWKRICAANYGNNFHGIMSVAVRDSSAIFATHGNSIYKYDLDQ